MKKIIYIVGFLLQSLVSFAGHIAGGEVYYKYLGPGAAPNSSRYEISLRLFRECNAAGANTSAMPSSVAISIFNNNIAAAQVGPQSTVNRTSFNQLQLTTPNPCITNPPVVCYQVGVFTFQHELPNTVDGYIVTFQTCCRTNGIENMQAQTFTNSGGGTFSGDGATYTGQIPGTKTLPLGTNNSPVFALKDTALVCQNSPFKLDFSATDPDAGDSLSYSFCAAYDRGNTTSAQDINYSSPPYNAISYVNGFSGNTPLGNSVTINPVTGIISGIAPPVVNTGAYVVAVCINEWRNGQIISSHRKDFTLRVGNCTLTGAELKPAYITCDGFALTFENQSTSSGISSYLWSFGDNTTSTNPTPTHAYADTGTYSVQLKVTSNNGCQDSTTAPVKIYPGFTTDFTVQGTCFLNSYTFKDATVTKYGVVNSWRWNFGDTTTVADTARSRDSAWRYSSARTVQATLITTNSKGCEDTMMKTITILDRPQLSLPFRDTLICSIDTLMLRVNISSGSVLWTPQNGPNKTRIQNASTATPLVYPQDSTKYYVAINDNGCANSDSVMVNVLKFISVDVRDTGICRTDSFRIRPTSDALSYQWRSSTTGEKVESIKNPMVQPLVTTQYNVTANLGKCQAKDSMQVTVVPYPAASAGPDATICYGTRTQLSATITGSQFSWTPTSSLVNENTLTPTAGPTKTTTYILTATDNRGCPKPKSDTVVVTVIPPIQAFAGNDTTILAGQPLQLQASGGIDYSWRPFTGMNNPAISNPIVTLDNSIDSIVYTVHVSEGGCAAEDQVTVRVYKNNADILVPSAFTPNGDGRNDIIRPALFGVAKFSYFSVYNRWGQLLFTTNEVGKGWNGFFSGVAQASGTYVYQAQGYDVLGNRIYRKGTFVLIR
jgi:gliding motility-associated-like protein